MKKVLYFLILLAIGFYTSAEAQISVKNTGKVKVGPGILDPQSLLEVQSNNTPAEFRVFAVSDPGKIYASLIWAMNRQFSIGLGVDEYGVSHVYKNVNSPFKVIDFEWDSYRYNYYNGTSLIMDYNGGQETFRSSQANRGFLGSASYPWNSLYVLNTYRASLPRSSSERINPARLSEICGYKYEREDTLILESVKKVKVTKGYGLIAEQVKESFPELISFSEKEGKYFIDYEGLIPVLIEGYKEQNNRIAQLEKEIGKLLGDETKPSSIKGCKLEQNNPNPFNSETNIHYTLTPEISLAYMYLYNLQGKQIKSIKLDSNSTFIKIQAQEFTPGIYLYSLIADRVVIDTKKLIITD